jgi:hypothetical protein
MMIDTGIGIILGADNMLFTITKVLQNLMHYLYNHHMIINLNSEPLNANISQLTAPSMTIGTRGSDVMETTITGESSEETAAWLLVSIQNIPYECSERGVALSVPQTTAPLQFNARDSYRDGYESDGELGSFFDAVMNEPSDSEDKE